jgi:paired amphipathic helix protein Sin3a
LTPRFLKRNLKYKGHQAKNINVRSGMQYKICRDTYHMFYIIGTEDAFVRRCEKPLVKSNNNNNNSNNNWNTWLNNHWSRGIQDTSIAESEALALLE